jgi:hypothetical protein
MSHTAAETVLSTRHNWERRWAGQKEKGGNKILVIFGADRSPFDLIQAAARGGTLGETMVPITTWTPEAGDAIPPAVKVDSQGRGVLAVLIDRDEQIGRGPTAWWTAVQIAMDGKYQDKIMVVVAVGPAVEQDPHWANQGNNIVTQGSNRTIHPAWAVVRDQENNKSTERAPGLF